MENIVRAATRKEEDTKHIIVINEQYDELVKRICLTGQEFYILRGSNSVAWNSLEHPHNLHIVNNLITACRRSFDFILCLNRANCYEEALRLSTVLHIPIIILDMTSSASKIPRPALSKINFPNMHLLEHRSAICYVGLSSIITESWSVTPNESFKTTIPLFPMTLNHSGDKILLDRSLPPEYYSQIKVDISNPKFTGNIEEAGAYLHVWENITPLLIDCIGSKLPVVSLGNMPPELSDLTINHIHSPDLLYSLDVKQLKVSDQNTTTQFEFVQSWNNLFKFINNFFFKKDENDK